MAGWVHADLWVCMLTPRFPWDPFMHKSRAKAGGCRGACYLCCEQPPPALGLHSAMPGCGSRHALGGPAEEGTFLPVCRRAQAGAGSSWPRPGAPLLFRSAILAGGGPAPGQVESWLWPWAKPSVSGEQFSSPKPHLAAQITPVDLGTRILFCYYHVDRRDLPEPDWVLWRGKLALWGIGGSLRPESRATNGLTHTPEHRTSRSAGPVNQASCMEMTARPLLLNSAELRLAQPRTKLADNGW